MTDSPYWRKARASENGSACVELSRDLKFIRDSKDLSGPVLAVDGPGFVRAVRAGRFDH